MNKKELDHIDLLQKTVTTIRSGVVTTTPHTVEELERKKVEDFLRSKKFLDVMLKAGGVLIVWGISVFIFAVAVYIFAVAAHQLKLN